MCIVPCVRFIETSGSFWEQKQYGEVKTLTTFYSLLDQDWKLLTTSRSNMPYLLLTGTNYYRWYPYQCFIIMLTSFLQTLPTIVASEFLCHNYRLQFASTHKLILFCTGPESFLFSFTSLTFLPIQTVTFMTTDIHFYNLHPSQCLCGIYTY